MSSRRLGFLAIFCALAACSSGGSPTSGTTGAGTGGTTGSTSSTTFSGSFTAATAFFEGGTSALDPNQLVINLLSQPMDCATWQDPNAAITGYDLQIALNGATAAVYTIVDPNSQQATNQTAGTSIAVDAYYDATNGESGVAAMSGSATISTITPGETVAGSFQITWEDGETLTVKPFSATYCADTNNWGGTFTAQSAFFSTSSGATNILLFDQPLSCQDIQTAYVPFGTTTWQIVVGATAAGTYPLEPPATASTGQALAYETYSNASVSSQNGNVVLSNVSSTALTVAVPNVGWSINQNSTATSITAQPCTF